MAKNEVSIELSVDTKEALRALNKFDKGIDETEKNAKNSASVMDRAFASFAGNLGALSVAGAFRGAIDGFRKLAAVGGELVNAASIQEDAINALNTQLRISGDLTAETSNELQKFASELQATTKFGDEAILSQLAFAQAMGASVEQSKAVLTAATDMAASLNIDLNSAVRNISKTLGGYAGELGEVVPELKNLTQEQLRAGEGIDLLADKFAGAAGDQIKTYSGATAQLSNTFGDLQESFGFFITQSPIAVAAIGGLNKAFAQIIGDIEKNRDSIQSLVTDAIIGGLVETAIPLATSALQFLNNGFNGTINFVNFVISKIGDFIIGFKKLRIAASEFDTAIGDFLGADTSDSEARTKRLQTEIKVIEKGQEQLLEKARQRVMTQDQINAAIQGTSDKIRSAIVNEIESVKQKNAKIIESETKKTQKVKELKQSEVDAKKAADLADQEAQALKDVLEEERFQMKLEKNTERFGAERALEIEHQTRLAEIREGERVANQKRRELESKAEVKALKDQEKRNRDSFFAIADYQKMSNKQRVQNLQGTLGTIATLSSSSNKTLFNIGKAAAISTATIDGIAAVQKALASAPPPFNLALAALVGTATAANVAKIATSKPPAFANGGVVGGFQGATGGPDNVNITARRGEMFLNGPQQRQLFENINSGGGNSDLVSAINTLANRPVVIEIEGREIARAVRDERLAGFAV